MNYFAVRKVFMELLAAFIFTAILIFLFYQLAKMSLCPDLAAVSPLMAVLTSVFQSNPDK